MPTYYLVLKLEDNGDDLPALMRGINNLDLPDSELESFAVPDDLVPHAKRLWAAFWG